IRIIYIALFIQFCLILIHYIIYTFSYLGVYFFFFFSSRRRHTRSKRDWSSDVCSSDLYLLSVSLFYQIQSSLSYEWFLTPHHFRSEERRVGKECRARRWRDQWEKKRRMRREKEVNKMK